MVVSLLVDVFPSKVGVSIPRGVPLPRFAAESLPTGLKAIKRGLLIISMPVCSPVLRAFTKSDMSRELEVTISLIYWALIAFFPRLLFMGESSTSEPTSSSVHANLFRIPLGVDLALHAAPAIALILDFFLLEQRYSKYQTARLAPVAAILFGLWYVCWIEYCASHNGMCTSPVSRPTRYR
jgi:hypothetical protein